MTIHPRYIGCDISKHFIDIHGPVSRSAQRLANTPAAMAAFAAAIAGSGALVVMEASGVYDRTLRTALTAAAVAYVRVNPTRARRFAQAAGFLAKTDAVDARMLSAFGAALNLAAADPGDPAREALGSLQRRRDQLVQMRADEKKRRCDAGDDLCPAIDRHIAWLSAEIAATDAKIAALNDRSPTLTGDAQRLQSAPENGRAHVCT